MYAPRELQHCRVSSQVNLPCNAQGERICHFVSVSFLFFFSPRLFFSLISLSHARFGIMYTYSRTGHRAIDSRLHRVRIGCVASSTVGRRLNRLKGHNECFKFPNDHLCSVLYLIFIR